MKPQKLKMYAEVADILNRKGIRPYTAREWNMPIVRGILYGNVKNKEIKQLVEKEYQNLLLSKLQENESR